MIIKTLKTKYYNNIYLGRKNVQSDEKLYNYETKANNGITKLNRKQMTFGRVHLK